MDPYSIGFLSASGAFEVQYEPLLLSYFECELQIPRISHGSLFAGSRDLVTTYHCACNLQPKL